MSKIRVLGIGSPSGDDQAGWLVADALLKSGSLQQAGVTIEKLDRPGISLIPLLANADWIILIDAMQCHPVQSCIEPGQVHHFDALSWPDYRHGLSSHGLGVIEALTLARELGEWPGRFDLFGIEVDQIQQDGPVTSRVLAGVQRLARHIEGELGRGKLSGQSATC